MSEDAAALWAALGDPLPGALLPTGKSPAWVFARRSLSKALCTFGLSWTVRSPFALWAIIRGGSPPPGSVWRDLLQDTGLEALVCAIRSRRSNMGWKFASWNPQWLRSPRSDKAAQKRVVVRRWLEAGRVVLLQETHWLPSDLAFWENAFPGATVIAYPAGRGPGGGPSGGVAILLPYGCRLVAKRELVQGCAVEVVATLGDGPRTRILCLYLPDGLQLQVVRRVRELLTADDTPTFVR